MSITSATFIKGIVGPDKTLEDGTPQVAFIGRSNVGKSSVINSLTKEKGLARVSSSPGLTREINVFLINKKMYLVDLPGYGYAKASRAGRDQLWFLISWYLLEAPYRQKKVVLIIDANVGPTDKDLEMLEALQFVKKDVLVVANKIDKLKKSVYSGKLKEIEEVMKGCRVIPYSAKKRIGVKELTNEILK